jgi:hypothetical protein
VLFIALGLAGLGWLLPIPRLPLELAIVAAIGAYVLAVCRVAAVKPADRSVRRLRCAVRAGPVAPNSGGTV